MKIKKLLLVLSITTFTLCGCSTETPVNKDTETAVGVETTPEDSETTTEDSETTPEDSETTPEDSETTPEDSEATSDELAYKLYNIFEEELNKANDTNNIQIEDIANKIIESDYFGEVMMGTMPIEEGYLAGFNNEIKGFKKGVTFSPMIGTIPFVGYIFETDTPESLVETLDKEHNLNWNICTSADTMLVKSNGNYVFFVMSPKSFENN